MGSLPLPSDNQLKGIFKHEAIDIYVLAIQESWPDSDASELLFQMCLGPSFVLFHSVNFGTLHMCIFLRRDLIWYTTGNKNCFISDFFLKNPLKFRAS